MSLLRPQCCSKLTSIRSSSSRSTRAFSRSAIRALAEPDRNIIPHGRSPPAGQDQAALDVTEHKPAGALEQYYPDHQPDYNAEIDHGTSTFSPVPKRVMDGSEPGETLPAAVLSGAPVDLQARPVKIYKPIKPATQSGSWGSHAWRMDWDPLPKGHRWENPLMGWQSSADFMQGTKLNFKSKEDAVAFAEKQGYEYYVQQPQERRFTPKAYANNFVHEPGPLKHIKTK